MTHRSLLFCLALLGCAPACSQDSSSGTDLAVDPSLPDLSASAPDLASACGPGLALCGGLCVNTSFDPAHCGGCDACGPGLVCSNGQCALTCLGGTTKCGDRCVDTRVDRQNCGGCAAAGGVVCGTGVVCSAGVCQASCGAGFVECNGSCIDPLTSRQFCGATGACGGDAGSPGTVCAAGQICANGGCVVSCVAGTTLCSDGKCHDLSTDNGHCGACSTMGTTDEACPAGTVCSAGSCNGSCVAGTTLCFDGKCHDLSTDNGHCGACSTMGTTDEACPAGTTCAAGICQPSCGAPLQACAGMCVDVRFDPDHCGSCTACPALANASRGCYSGSCIIGACTVGFRDCDGDGKTGCEVNLDSDVNNCGSCGKKCVAFEVCVGGACVCGGVNQPCCGGTTCGAGTTCVNSVCRKPCAAAENVAGSATAATYDAHIAPYLASNCNDDVMEASNCSVWSWVSASTTPSGAWWTYTWPSAQTISRMHIDTLSGTTSNSCSNVGRTLGNAQVQWWDGSSWITDGAVSNQMGDWDYFFTAPVSTDRVRLFNVYVPPTVMGQTSNPILFEWQVCP